MIARALAVTAAGLVAASPALAADPRGTAHDLAEGRLDRSLTQQELSRVLGDATVEGYAPPEGVVLAEELVLPQPVAPGFLPITGVDLALMTGGGALLLLLGLVLRRLSGRGT